MEWQVSQVGAACTFRSSLIASAVRRSIGAERYSDK